MKNKFYVTTPIYYATAAPHLGSLYSTLLADVAAKWNMLNGKETFFLTGTDEHGQKIEAAAKAAGKKPKEFVDGFIDAYKNVWHDYQIDYTKFIRTTDKEHVKAVQKWISQLLEKGDIYKGKYEGMYCTPCETFVTDLKQEDTECPSCTRSCVLVSEEAYFFKLSAYQDKLLEFYKSHPDFVFPKARINEVVSFVESGLKDLCISRSTLKWGIPFPNDETHVAYVWADALNNYITAIGYLDKSKQADFEKWWPADLQILGKDIVRFHAVYWPAFLMASGLPLPKHLLVHGWIKINEQKMSKSLGNAVDPIELKNQFGADEVRCYLTSQMAVTQDSEFSIKGLKEFISKNLANDLGNLLNRTITLALRSNLELVEPKELSDDSKKLKVALEKSFKTFKDYMEQASFHMAMAEIWKFTSKVNSYFHSQEPWKLAKSDEDKFKEVIFVTCSSLQSIASLLWPVMPAKMESLLAQIGGKLGIEMVERWLSIFKLKAGENLFKKYDAEEEPKEEAVEEKKENYISIDDFAKVELSVGTIVECVEVPKSDKLLKMQVDFGPKGMRQIFGGIKKFYKREDLIGKQGVFVINLKPRKMMGMESQGMMLTAESAEGLARIIPSEVVEAGINLK
jgi:methionyl-tRNA synthetase